MMHWLSITVLSLQWAAEEARYIHESSAYVPEVHHGTVTKSLPDCINVTRKELHIHGAYDGYSVNESISMQMFSAANHSRNGCFPLSPQLLHCNLSEIGDHDYQIKNYSMFRGEDLIARLGDYYIDDSGRGYTCEPYIRSSTTTPRCHYLLLDSDQYMLQTNGSLYIRPAQTWLHRPEYVIDGPSGQVNVCYPLSIAFLNCEFRYRNILTPFRYSLQSSLDLYSLFDDVWFRPGEYYFVNDILNAAICIRHPVIYHVIKGFLYVSGICVALAFFYQLLEPRDTCHKKCFLRHNFSLAIECCWVAYARYTPDWPSSLAGRYVKFTIGYLSTLTTAFWLSIGGYEVWQSFVWLNQRHHRSSDNRRFLYYSIVGWGAPYVMLSIVMVVNFSSFLQELLSLSPKLSNSGWFHDHSTSVIFHYMPLLLLYCVNAVFFFCTVHQIRRAGKGTRLVNHSRKQQLLLISLRLSVVMGALWVIERILWIISGYTTFPIRHISDPILVLQGLVYFGLTTFKKQTPRLLREKIRAVHSAAKSVLERMKRSPTKVESH